MGIIEKTPVLIVGAGPGGAAAALQLDKLGIKCTIIDKAVFPRDKICGDAMSGKVISVLRRINPAIVESIEQSTDAIGSWGVLFAAPNLHTLRVPFKTNYVQTLQCNVSNKNKNAPGFLSKRIDFDNLLIQHVKQAANVQLHEGCEAATYTRQNNTWTVTCTDGRTIETPLLIIADGAHSKFAKHHANIHLEPAHFCAGLRVYYKNVQGLDKDNFIELHFLKDFLPGYFWIFPLPNGYANVGVGLRSDVVAKRKINLKKKLDEILKKYPHIQERFKDAEPVDAVRGFGLPLGSKKRALSGNGYMLTGDAASLIDPFTGEGIGNAVVSGKIAADMAAEAIKQQAYDAATLKQYDNLVYKQLWSELNMSYRIQQLANYPRLFNLVIEKARRSPALREMITGMFENTDLRRVFKSPAFYLKLLFTNN